MSHRMFHAGRACSVTNFTRSMSEFECVCMCKMLLAASARVRAPRRHRSATHWLRPLSVRHPRNMHASCSAHILASSSLPFMKRAHCTARRRTVRRAKRYLKCACLCSSKYAQTVLRIAVSHKRHRAPNAGVVTQRTDRQKYATTIR